MKKVKKPLSETHPHLLKEWDYEKNELSPDDVTYGSNKKVYWKCPKGSDHRWRTVVANRALQGKGCPFCSGNRVSVTNSLATVYPEVAARWHPTKNGKLTAADVLPGSARKVWWKCSEEHEWLATVGSRALLGNGCPFCAGVAKPTIDEVRHYFESEGYVLLSEEYGNARTYLDYICDKGHKGRTTWNHFQRGRRCPVCAGSVKLTIDFVKGSFEKIGYTLLSDEYIDSGAYLEYICNNGHKGRTVWDNFKQGHRCPACACVAKPTIGSVRDLFEREGYTLLSEEYINNRAYLDFLCDKGHKGRITWNCFQRGQRCPSCVSGNVSKVSQEWLDFLGIPNKPGKTRERRIWIDGRLYKLDGYDPKTNMIYEFLGDYWHGNPDNSRFHQGDIHPDIGKSYGDVYKETMKRIKTFEKAGYTVVYIWEKDFREIKWI